MQEPRAFTLERRGLMLAISSPSGAGKSTITRALLKGDRNLKLSISVTTRPPRLGERDGEHYFFRSAKAVQAMIARGELLEHAKVFDHHYGSPRQAVDDVLTGGGDVLFDIDWQGVRQLTRSAGADLVRVFILPPSLAELSQRLRSRGQDSDAVIAARMSRAVSEMSHWSEYDYVVVNEDVDISTRMILSIIEAERLKRGRQTGLSDFVAAMCG